jgi:hypothetical protein
MRVPSAPRSAFLAGAILLAALAQAWTLGAAPARAETAYGLHQDLTYDGYQWRRAQGIDAARRVGATISRNSFVWNHVERSPGVYDWSRYDAVVAELEAAGLDPVFVILGSPSWANGVASDVPDAKFYVPAGTGAEFQRWVDRYEEFVRIAVRRYRGRVHRWELWNEQNESWFWKPAPSVEQYAIWYRAIRQAIREEDPGAQTALGGLAGISVGCCITGRRFLERLGELGVHPDRVALHPYPSGGHAPDVDLPWQDNFSDIKAVHDQLALSGHPARIWVTEWGWESASVGLDTQARYVRTSLEMIRDRYPFVEVATHFVDYDRPTYSQGLFAEDFAEKPAAREFASFMAALRTSSPPPEEPAPPPQEPAPPPQEPAPPPEEPAPPSSDPLTGLPAEPPATGEPAPPEPSVEEPPPEDLSIGAIETRVRGRNLHVSTFVTGCRRCRGRLAVRARGRTRTVTMRRAGNRLAASTRAPARGRVQLSLLVVDGGATRSARRSVRIR